MLNLYHSVSAAETVKRDAEGVPIKPWNVCEARTQTGEYCCSVSLHHNGHSVLFGWYNSRAEAARVADRAAIVMYGDLAVLNMPGDISDQEKAELQSISDVTAYACKCRELAAQQWKLDGVILT
jgi:hypothetical protein